MKLSIVLVFLLIVYIARASKESFDCPLNCICSKLKLYTCEEGNDEVKFSWLSDNHLSVQCTNDGGIKFLHNFLTNITDLSIKQCNLQENSSKGQFTAIKDNNTKIRNLFIESNSVVQMDLSSFEKLQVLEDLVVVISSSSTEKLKFNFNLLTAMKIKSINLTNIGAHRDLVIQESFSDTYNKFSQLIINGFNLKMLNRDSFKWLFKTEKLELINNSMTFSDGGFQQISNNINLKDLKIENNKIPNGVLPDLLLALFHKLENVSLDNNKLQSIPRELFLDSVVIKRLSMKHNAIKELPLVLPNHCIELDLSNNQIENIKYIRMSKMEILKLSNNKISLISSNIYQLRQLRELHLDGNQITDKLCDEIILRVPSMIKLEHLKLNSNLIKEFSLQKWNGKYEGKTIKVDLRENNLIDFNLETETDPPSNIQFTMDKIKYNNTCEAKDIKIFEYISKNVKFSKSEAEVSSKLKNVLQGREFLIQSCDRTDECPVKCDCAIIHDSYLIGCFNSSLETFPSIPSNLSIYKIEMDLSYNNITKLPRDLSSKLHIIKIDASNNKITNIYDDNIPENIELLDVRNNPVIHMEAGVKEQIKHERIIKDPEPIVKPKQQKKRADVTEKRIEATTLSNKVSILGNIMPEWEPVPEMSVKPRHEEKRAALKEKAIEVTSIRYELSTMPTSKSGVSTLTIVCLVVTSMITLSSIIYISYKTCPCMNK